MFTAEGFRGINPGLQLGRHADAVAAALASVDSYEGQDSDQEDGQTEIQRLRDSEASLQYLINPARNLHTHTHTHTHTRA